MVEEHNNSKLKEIMCEENPLISFNLKYQFKAKGNHFQKFDFKDTSVSLCRGCKVSLTRNIWQEVGLYNGAIGTVKEIRFKQGKNPLNGDMPEYIIVSFREY